MLASFVVAPVLVDAAAAAFTFAVVASIAQTAVGLTKALCFGYWQNFVVVYFSVVAAELRILAYPPSYL